MSSFTDELMKQLRFISDAGNAFMKQNKQRLTGQQRVLAILKMEDGMKQSFLAELLDLRPSSIAELVKKMEAAGDIVRLEDETDKRIKRIHLTDQGREKAEKNASLKEANHSEAFFAGLTEEEQQAFHTSLEKVAEGWDADFKESAKRFTDPMDRFQKIQEFRDSFFEGFENMDPEVLKKMRKMERPFHNRFADNLQKMSPEDIEKIQSMRESFMNYLSDHQDDMDPDKIREMQEEMAHAMRDFHRDSGGRPRGFGREFPHGFWRRGNKPEND